MANLDIKIKGLALCYFDETTGNWRVFFPKVDDHDFKIIVESIRGSKRYFREYPIQTATQMNLIPDNTTNSAVQNNLADAVDIVALHGENLVLTSDESKYAGMLTLQNCFLKSEFDPMEPLEIDIWDTRQPTEIPDPNNPPTKAWIRREKITTEFSSRFVTTTDSSIKITMRSGFEIDLSAEINIKQEDHVKYTITFSNDCEGVHCESESDFKYFYEIIDETAFTVKRRFEMILVEKGDRGKNGSPCGGIHAPFPTLTIPPGV
jgi:hypothetical protein